MAPTTRRQFINETAVAAAALYGCPIKTLEALFEQREPYAAVLDPASVRRLLAKNG